MKIEIDKLSGFCYGVTKAINSAEVHLKKNKESKNKIFSLGAIVHNNSEIDRLKKEGLEIIDIQEMENLKDATVLIRAHGEPPSTYRIAKENNIKLIDCTCPVVLALQKKIESTKEQILIYGKNGHAEVNGLVGKSEGRAIVIESIEDIEKLIASSAISFSKPIHIFSQTTKDPIEYEKICNALKEKMGSQDNLFIHNTICKAVAKRHEQIIGFAKEHDAIIFVCGKESSNGHVLYELCKSVNPHTHLIQSLSQIDSNWFKTTDTIGICGATSTPKWQLQSVSKFLKITLNNYLCSKLYRIIYGNYSRF